MRVDCLKAVLTRYDHAKVPNRPQPMACTVQAAGNGYSGCAAAPMVSLTPIGAIVERRHAKHDENVIGASSIWRLRDISET